MNISQVLLRSSPEILYESYLKRNLIRYILNQKAVGQHEKTFVIRLFDSTTLSLVMAYNPVIHCSARCGFEVKNFVPDNGYPVTKVSDRTRSASSYITIFRWIRVILCCKNWSKSSPDKSVVTP